METKDIGGGRTSVKEEPENNVVEVNGLNAVELTLPDSDVLHAQFVNYFEKKFHRWVIYPSPTGKNNWVFICEYTTDAIKGWVKELPFSVTVKEIGLVIN
jgi:hypothetical protein